MSDTPEVTLEARRRRKWVHGWVGRRGYDLGDFMLTIRASRTNVSEGHDPTERTYYVLGGRLKVRTNRAKAKANRRWLFVNVGMSRTWAHRFVRVEVGRFGITVKGAKR